MQYVVRPARAGDWKLVKELRLAALADPAAAIAFLDKYDEAAARPDSFWQERAAMFDAGTAARQFVAEASDGTWIGSVVVFVERPGSIDFLGNPIEEPQGHIVGVYVSSDHRGSGVADDLCGAAIGWAWSVGEPRLVRLRLFVHERNLRAQAFYRRMGFAPSGRTVPFPGEPPADELEFTLTHV